MEQLALIHESVRDATRSAIAALGGIKKVATQLRPAWEPERAQRWLANALDDNRPEKLEFEDYIWIFRAAKRIGYHDAMAYFARECEYDVTPVEPETELTRLLREYMESEKRRDQLKPIIDERIAKLSSITGGRAA